MKNVSDLFATLPETQKQGVDNVVTHIINVFKNKDSTLLLQLYSSFYQYIYEFLSIRNRQSLLTFLVQTSKHLLDIVKQFDFQNISKAFVFLSEAVGVLEGISDVPLCQKLLSIFNFLELEAESLKLTEGHELMVIHATLTGLRQLLRVDEGVRNSLFQYMSQFFNGSLKSLWGDECLLLKNKHISSSNDSIDKGSPFILPWSQSFLALSKVVN